MRKLILALALLAAFAVPVLGQSMWPWSLVAGGTSTEDYVVGDGGSMTSSGTGSIIADGLEAGDTQGTGARYLTTDETDCSSQTNGGKLTLNASGETVCAPDVSGTGGGGTPDPNSVGTTELKSPGQTPLATNLVAVSGSNTEELVYLDQDTVKDKLGPDGSVGDATVGSQGTDLQLNPNVVTPLEQDLTGNYQWTGSHTFPPAAAVDAPATVGTAGLTINRCVQTDAQGKLTVAGDVCGTPSGAPGADTVGTTQLNDVARTPVEGHLVAVADDSTETLQYIDPADLTNVTTCDDAATCNACLASVSSTVSPICLMTQNITSANGLTILDFALPKENLEVTLDCGGYSLIMDNGTPNQDFIRVDTTAWGTGFVAANINVRNCSFEIANAVPTGVYLINSEGGTNYPDIHVDNVTASSSDYGSGSVAFGLRGADVGPWLITNSSIRNVDQVVEISGQAQPSLQISNTRMRGRGTPGAAAMGVGGTNNPYNGEGGANITGSTFDNFYSIVGGEAANVPFIIGTSSIIGLPANAILFDQASSAGSIRASVMIDGVGQTGNPSVDWTMARIAPGGVLVSQSLDITATDLRCPPGASTITMLSAETRDDGGGGSQDDPCGANGLCDQPQHVRIDLSNDPSETLSCPLTTVVDTTPLADQLIAQEEISGRVQFVADITQFRQGMKTEAFEPMLRNAGTDAPAQCEVGDLYTDTDGVDTGPPTCSGMLGNVSQQCQCIAEDTWVAVASNTYRPEDYAAGSNTSGIQEAIDAACDSWDASAGGGGIVQLSAADYPISEEIVLDCGARKNDSCIDIGDPFSCCDGPTSGTCDNRASPVTLLGVGWNKNGKEGTEIVNSNTGGKPMIRVRCGGGAGTCTGTTLRGFQLSMDNIPASEPGCETLSPLGSTDCSAGIILETLEDRLSHVVISDVLVRNLDSSTAAKGVGIRSEGAFDLTFSNVYFEGLDYCTQWMPADTNDDGVADQSGGAANTMYSAVCTGQPGGGHRVYEIDGFTIGTLDLLGGVVEGTRNKGIVQNDGSAFVSIWGLYDDGIGDITSYVQAGDDGMIFIDAMRPNDPGTNPLALVTGGGTASITGGPGLDLGDMDDAASLGDLVITARRVEADCTTAPRGVYGEKCTQSADNALYWCPLFGGCLGTGWVPFSGGGDFVTAAGCIDNDNDGTCEVSANSSTEVAFDANDDGVAESFFRTLGTTAGGATIGGSLTLGSNNAGASVFRFYENSSNTNGGSPEFIAVSGADSVADGTTPTCTLEDDNTPFDGCVGDTTVDYLTSGTIRGNVSVIDWLGGPRTLTANETRGTFVTHAAGTPSTLTLPIVSSAGVGASTCVYSETLQVITLAPNAADRIRLNGNLLGQGQTIASEGLQGDFICVLAARAGEWVTLGRSGTWQ